MTTITTRSSGRKLGIEPSEIDLTPIVSQPYTEAESKEIDAFFEQQRAENDKLPAVVALREAVARQQSKS